jgi:membrane protein YdbS with pleckstrin-like domain
MTETQWLRLHPKAKAALVIKAMIGMIFFMVFIIPSFLFMILETDFSLTIFLLFVVVIICILFLIVITWAHMFYNRYHFRVGGDAVYINRGILWKRNVVIPYERIQHTSTTRGPIDLLMGLHILNIFTAGTGSVGARFGGGASAFAAEGSIPGLADPKPFQEAIMAKVHMLKGDGLGAGTQNAKEIATLKPGTQDEMLEELRKIREILEKGEK